MHTFLLIVAIIVTVIGFMPLLLIHSYRNRKQLGKYHLNLATNIDYIWASLLFGTDGHTVSAICYKKSLTNDKYTKYINAINWVFNDDLHCELAYEYEFITRPNLTLKVSDAI